MTRRWTVEVFALVCWVVLPSTGLAQIRIGAELRGRVEFNSDPAEGRDERLYFEPAALHGRGRAGALGDVPLSGSGRQSVQSPCGR